MKYLDRFTKKGNALLGTKIPVICGAMTWISTSGFVAQVCNAGAFGVLAGGNLPPEMFREEIRAVRRLTTKPFGVNLITIAPNYLKHLEVACEEKVSHIVFAGSIPSRNEIQTAKQSRATVFCFAPAETIAERMVKYGADALVLEGSESGGHIGHVSTMVLLQQVLFKITDTPIFVAGGVATGQMAAHLLLMGAAGVQMGTRFVMTDECPVHPNFKERFRRARAREALSTPQYSAQLSVVSVRSLLNSATEEFNKLQVELINKLRAGEITRPEAQFRVESFWIGGLRKAAVEGDVENGSVMAGQSVGLVDNIVPLRTLLDEFAVSAESELKRVFEKTSPLKVVPTKKIKRPGTIKKSGIKNKSAQASKLSRSNTKRRNSKKK